MEKTTLFTHEENDLAIYHYPEHNILQTYVKGKISHDAYKLCNEKAFEFLKDLNIKKVVYDQSDIISTDMRSRAWYTATYVPKIFKALGSDFTGSIIRSRSNFENMTVEFMIKAAKALGLKNDVAVHNNLEEALDWIKNK